MILTEYYKWQTYPYENVSLGQYRLKCPQLIPVEADQLKVTGKIVSIKDSAKTKQAVFRMELDVRSLQLVLKVARTVNQKFTIETGHKLQSINVFESGIIRFRRREGNSSFNRFNSLIGTQITIKIKPESVYQGKHYSLNWVCESF